MRDTSGHAPLGTHNGTGVQQSADDKALTSQASNEAAVDCVCGSALPLRSSCTISCS